jgi:glycosyltransferase involved in cell wall biosynthesis
LKVAIVHYWFITRRGGEKVVESLLKLYPEADIYTLFYDKDEYGDFFKNQKIITSKINLPIFRNHHQKVFPLYPIGIKSLKLKENYDLIISSESGPAKGIKINNDAIHICYIHSPMRYCWGFKDEYLKALNPALRPLVIFFLNKLKKWDQNTIDNVDLYIANSINVQKRVQDFYGKKAEVIYPPISSVLFENKLPENQNKTHFLSFGAITPYKKIDLLIECFNKNGQKLIVIGNGSERKKLQAKAKNNIEFKGFLKDNQLKEYIIKSRALIFPGEEDFGMIPLEVMSYGIPVIAFAKGGALETVVEDHKNVSKSSGIFFKEQTVHSLQNAINEFEKIENNFDPNWIRSHAKNFDEQKFLYKFSEVVSKLINISKN